MTNITHDIDRKHILKILAIQIMQYIKKTMHHD